MMPPSSPGQSLWQMADLQHKKGTRKHHLFLLALLSADRRMPAPHPEQLGLDIAVAGGIEVFKGNSHSLEYRLWRESKGMIDLVLIDGDHTFEGVSRDFEINQRYSHRCLCSTTSREAIPAREA